MRNQINECTMTVTSTLSGNPYCRVRNEVININYGNRNYEVPVEKVSKMYLSRKKRNYLSFIPGVKFFTFDSTYNLFIKTRDGKDLTISVKSFEKQHFVGLISYVRGKMRLPSQHEAQLN